MHKYVLLLCVCVEWVGCVCGGGGGEDVHMCMCGRVRWGCVHVCQLVEGWRCIRYIVTPQYDYINLNC